MNHFNQYNVLQNHINNITDINQSGMSLMYPKPA